MLFAYPLLERHVPAQLGAMLVVSPVLGWFALTLGCSIYLIWEARRANGERGWMLATSVIGFTPLVMLLHGVSSFGVLVIVAGASEFIYSLWK